MLKDYTKHDFNLQMSVTANGMALHSETARRSLVEDFDQLTLSIDGLGPLHDQYRDASGLFEHLRLSLIRLREMKTTSDLL